MKTDTSALEARNGKDIQGIPWERLNFTRDKYREARLKQYKNYESLAHPRQDLEKVPSLFELQNARSLHATSRSIFFWAVPLVNLVVDAGVLASRKGEAFL